MVGLVIVVAVYPVMQAQSPDVRADPVKQPQVPVPLALGI